MLVPGSLVFHRTPGPVDLRDFRNWWSYVPGASWARPEGPGSDVYTRARHPVPQVAYHDVLAYAAWAGKALPTEAECEYAARGGLDGVRYARGDEAFPDGRAMANTWRASSRGRTWSGRLRRHIAGGCLPGRWIRAVRHNRKRPGVDLRSVRGRRCRSEAAARPRCQVSHAR